MPLCGSGHGMPKRQNSAGKPEEPENHPKKSSQDPLGEDGRPPEELRGQGEERERGHVHEDGQRDLETAPVRGSTGESTNHRARQSHQWCDDNSKRLPRLRVEGLRNNPRIQPSEEQPQEHETDEMVPAKRAASDGFRMRRWFNWRLVRIR